MQTFTCELRGNDLYDANGALIYSAITPAFTPMEPGGKNTKVVLELVKLGVETSDIIQLKHQGLL